MQILNNPYPFDNRLGTNIKINVYIGLFVALFLIVFEPFGTGQWEDDDKVIKLMGYGVLSFAIPTILFLFVKWYMDIHHLEQHYKVKHEIFWLLSVLLGISMANCLYISYIHNIPFSFRLFKYGILMVMAIGFFPILASVILKHNRYLTLNSKDAEELDELASTTIQDSNKRDIDSSILTLIADNGKDMLQIEVYQLLYIESLENYVKIHYSKDNVVHHKVLRSSLKKIEEQLNDDFIVKCHRSFIVNLSHVIHVTGNAQGYLMSIANHEPIVPVSRSYGSKILSKMKLLHR